MVRLTNMLVPRMQKKKRGIILCIGSLLGTGPATKRYTTYGATKVSRELKTLLTPRISKSKFTILLFIFSLGFCG